MSSNPYSDDNQPSPYAFQSQVPGSNSSGDGYVKQIPVLGILHIVQAVLELPMFVVLIAFSGLMVTAQNSPQLQAQQAQNGQFILLMAVLYGLLGAVVGLTALMRFISGILLITKRGRIFALFISVMGLVSVFTCYCAPTSLALSIYSLVVLIQPSVIAEFKRGTS